MPQKRECNNCQFYNVFRCHYAMPQFINYAWQRPEVTPADTGCHHHKLKQIESFEISSETPETILAIRQ